MPVIQEHGVAAEAMSAEVLVVSIKWLSALNKCAYFYRLYSTSIINKMQSIVDKNTHIYSMLITAGDI